MSKLKIAVIIGSTRPTRFADIPAQWMLKQANAHPEIEAEIVDLRDFDLPFFDEAASNLWVPSKGAAAQKWQKKIGGFDGFIFVVAEYNRSMTGALKNALDQAYVEWNRKPMTAIAYGGVGGARALEHLRLAAVELQMVPTRSAVHISGGDFFAINPGLGGTKSIQDVEGNLLGAAKAALDELAWWGKITKAAR